MTHQGPRRTGQGSYTPGPVQRGSEPPMGPPQQRPQVGGYNMAGVLVPRDAFSPTRSTNYARDAFSPTRNMFNRDQSPYAQDSKGDYRARSYASPPPMQRHQQQYQRGKSADFPNHMTQPKGEKRAYIDGTAPSGLTRQIDKFLKKSDHTLDRWQAVLNRRNTGSPNNSDNSQNTTSAADIAAKAKRHLELLSRVTAAKKAAPIAEEDDLSTSSSSVESLDGFDTDDDVGTTHAFELSDDTSAEISKLSNIGYDKSKRSKQSSIFDISQLDDLSSDSDDEYFDVLAFNRPGNPVKAPKLSDTQKPAQKRPEQQPSHVPLTHSQSVPSVNKAVPRVSKMGNLMGTATTALTEATMPSPQIPVTVNEINSTPAQAPYVKRHTAPLPLLGKQQIPVTVNDFTGELNNQQQKTQTPESPANNLAPPTPLAEEVPRTPGSVKKYRAPQPPGSNLSINTLDGSTQNINGSTNGSNKELLGDSPRLSRDRSKTQRVPSFKKNRAPQPPESNSGSTQSLQSVQNERITPIGEQVQQPVGQISVSQTPDAALASKTSQTIPNSLTHPSPANANDPSEPKIANGNIDKTEKAAVASAQNTIITDDANKNTQHVILNKSDKSKTDATSKPVQPADLQLSASWVHLGPQKAEVTDTNLAKKSENLNETQGNISVGRTKESVQGVNPNALLNGTVPTSPPGPCDVQGAQGAVTSKLVHNADQGGIGEKKTDNNSEKPANDSLKVQKDDKNNKTKESDVDKGEKDKTVLCNGIDQKNEIKSETESDNKTDKSNDVKVVADKKNSEVISDKDKSCDIKAKNDTKESEKDKSNSVSKLKVTGDESKKDEIKDNKPISNGCISNGHIPREENNTDKDSKPKKEFGKSPNKTIKFGSKEKVDESTSGSRVSSRASSVSTNRSRTCSPSSGPNRGISSKLASICKMLENDVSEKSDRSKSRSVSRSSSGLGIKPGKIDGIASMFEKDKMKNKLPPEKDPNSVVGKLLKSNPCSAPFNPDPRPPDTKPKTQIGGFDISKFGEVTKPSRNMLAAKRAEVQKRAEELKKKNEALKTEKDKGTGGKISSLASKFGMKEESGNKILSIASKFGKKEEPKPVDKNKAEGKKEEVDKAVVSINVLDKGKKESLDENKGSEKVKVEDGKVDGCKELDNKEVVDKKDSLDKSGDLGIDKEKGKVGEGNEEKDKQAEVDKSKDSSMTTNKGDNVDDKSGKEIAGDNIKVEMVGTDKDSNNIDEGKEKDIKGLEMTCKEENKVKVSKVDAKEQKSKDDLTSPDLDDKDSKIMNCKESKEISTDMSAKTVTSVAHSDTKMMNCKESKDISTDMSTKTVTSVADSDSKMINCKESKEISTDMSTKTVTSVADIIVVEKPVILEEGKILNEDGEVKEKIRRKKKKKPEDGSLPNAGCYNDSGSSSSSETATLTEKVPSEKKLSVNKVSTGKEKTPGQVETERSMEEANGEKIVLKSMENDKTVEVAKDDKVHIDVISSDIKRLPSEDDKAKEIKLDDINKVDEGTIKEKLVSPSENEINCNSIKHKDGVSNHKLEEKKDTKEEQGKVESLIEKDDITAALERQIQKANSLIEEANLSINNNNNVDAVSNRKLSLQRSPSTLHTITEENVNIMSAKPENLPQIDHLDKAAVRHLQCLEQEKLTKLSSELTRVRDTLKPVSNKNEMEEDIEDTIVVTASTPLFETMSPVAGIVNGKLTAGIINGKLTARIRPLHELESEVESLIEDANKLIDPSLMITPEEELFKRTVSPPPATIVKGENGEIEIYHDAPEKFKLEDPYDMSKMDTLCELPDSNGIMSPRDWRARSVTSWGKNENGITSPRDRRARSITSYGNNDPTGFMSPRARSIAWGDNDNNDPSGYVSPRDRRARSIAWGDNDNNDPSSMVSPRERRARSIAWGENDNNNGVMSPWDRRARSVTPWDDTEDENSRYARGSTPLRIAQTDAILSETDRLLRRSRSKNSLRRSYSRQMAEDCDLHLSSITADLTEEHSTATLAGERLEAEQAERMRLESDVDNLQGDVRRIEQERNKLELESLHRRTDMLLNSEVNGDDLDDDLMDSSLYKRKYEWCLKEIDVLKKQLKTQQEDDFDQLVVLKKQLEKKVFDANEEADEQRQVVAQMKKKSQRLTAEMNDLKILLEEQSSRNNLLEKKQRKFDQDVQAVQEELRHERTNKDRIQREKDSTLSEKYSFEQEVSTLKLELELKEEKVSALNRELDDLSSSGKIEEEVHILKRAKHELELRIKDQEEELDDMAGQVQMLEGAKVRLEMSIEQMRKENRREQQQREEELDEVRMGAQKKVKALELQIENEHDERTLLVRERHELERRIADLQERTITSIDEDYVHKLKKELKKTKVLLKDTQTMLDKSQSESSSKLIVRQLKTQLEDAEFAKTAAIKARQSAEADLQDLQASLDEAQRLRKDAEERTGRLVKDRTELQTQLDESEEEVAEVMKKYKATVSQLSVDQITLSEQSQMIAELEHDKQMMHDRLTEMTSKVEVLEGETANIHTQRRLEMKIKEMDSKLELELTTRQRLESQISRLRDQIERLGGECESAKQKENQSVDHSKKLGRQLRENKEDLSTLQQRHTDVSNKKQELEKQMELQDSEITTLKSDLKLAFKRIEEFQQALQGDLSDSDSDISDRGEAAHSPTSEGAMSMISEDEEFLTRDSYA